MAHDVGATRVAAELEPYLDLHRDGSSLRSTVARLSPAALACLDRTALLMLRPDSFANGSALAILDWLRHDHGLDIVRVAIRRVSQRTFDELYLKELPLIAPGLRLHHRISADAPSAFVLLTGPASQEASLSSRVDALKGATSPSAETGEDTLRARFGRQSSFHVVAHTAEDAGEALAGAIAAFGQDDVVGLLHSLADGSIEPLDDDTVRLLVGEVAAPPARDVYAVAISVKRRICAELRRLCPHLGGEVDELAELYARVAIDEAASFVGHRDAYVAMARFERPVLKRLIALTEPGAAGRDTRTEGNDRSSVAARWRALDLARAPAELAYVSWFLSGHERYGRDDGEAIFAVLDEHSIVLSAWERSLVSAGLICDLDPGFSFAGVRTYPLDPPPAAGSASNAS